VLALSDSSWESRKLYDPGQAKAKAKADEFISKKSK
jgi:hypothetical protein